MALLKRYCHAHVLSRGPLTLGTAARMVGSLLEQVGL